MKTIERGLFGKNDIHQMKVAGISPEESLRQLKFFRHPPESVVLDRPCVPGDGVQVLSEAEADRLAGISEGARLSGRFSAFIPASGASSRMFKFLLGFFTEPSEVDCTALQMRARRGDAASRDALIFIDGLRRFPFFEDLKAVMLRDRQDVDAALDRGQVGRILAYLLTPRGLDYASLPKALLPFHRYPDGNRTALEEHLAVGEKYLRDKEGVCRLHFTVAPEHEPFFEALVRRASPPLERIFGCRYQIRFSTQKKSSDTLAVDLENRPFRLEDGRLLFRPGGHGALIGNLSGSGDIVFLNNIDNVSHLEAAVMTDRWRKVLGGYLVELQAELFDHLSRLARKRRDPKVLQEAVEFATSRLPLSVSRAAQGSEVELTEWLVDRLNRPLRVCGVVQNTGEPGGRPFWVQGRSGELSPQLVEGAQVAESLDQQVIFSWSTHFNPVNIVCALRDWKGRPFDLEKFVDPTAVFISRRSHQGKELKALERPGLWNGAMAGWNTVIVEVPLSTFNPVKTVNDLLKPGHQPSQP